MTTKRNTEQVVTSIRIPRDTHKQLVEIAEREERSVSGTIRLLIADLLEREQGQAA